MNIAFVNLKPLNHTGGAEMWIRKVCEILNDNGDEVVILVPSSGNGQEKIFGINHLFFKSRVHSLLKKLRLENLYPPFLSCKFSDGFDAVYVSTIHPIMLFRSLLHRKKKLIIGTHDLFIPNRPMGIDIYQKISIMGIKYLASRGRIIIHSLNSMTSKALKNTKAEIFEIGNEFLAYKSLTTGHHDTNECCVDINKHFTILFLGNIEPRKGSRLIPKVVEKFQLFNDISFIFAGKVKDSRILKKMNTIPSVAVFKGPVSEFEKINLLRTSDLFIFLSNREASPIVVEEVFSFGIPVVSTWRGIEQLKSFQYSLCKLSGRTADEIRDSINSFYNLWRADKRSYNSEKYLRALSYRDRFNGDSYEKAIIQMFSD